MRVRKTMQIAQGLYEGVDVGEEGTIGLITYMRTDSTRLSDDAQAMARDFILERYGDAYHSGKQYKVSGRRAGRARGHPADRRPPHARHVEAVSRRARS